MSEMEVAAGGHPLEAAPGSPIYVDMAEMFAILDADDADDADA